MRIVSLIPSATEIVCALGAGEHLVGRSHECDYPAAVRSLPVCTAARLDTSGASADIDRAVKAALTDALAVYEVFDEILHDLAPDVIITQEQCDVCAVSLADVERAVCEWTDKNTQIVSLNPQCMADFYEDLARVGRAIGKEMEAEALIDVMQQRSAEIEARSVDLPRPITACIEWTDPLMAAGNWVPEHVALAGGRDPFGTPGAHAPWLEWHQVVDVNPDVIIFMPCGFDLARTRAEAAPLTERPEWPGLKAVRAGRVYVTDANSYFNRPGPRLADSLEIMAEVLHPEAFEFGHCVDEGGSGWDVFSTLNTRD